MLDQLVIAKTNSTLIQLLRYTVVGGIAFSVDFATLFLLTDSVGFHYLVAAGMAFLAGLATNYALSVRWVFDCRKIDSRVREFFLFFLVGVIGLGFNEVFIWLFTELARFHYLLSKIASTVFVYLWNFFARKYLLFTPEES